MKKSIYFTGLLLIVCFVISCTEESSYKDKMTFVSTSAMSEITSLSAKATGDVATAENENISERGFLWGETPILDSDNGTKLSSGSGPGNFTANLTGLTLGKDYYIRSYAINNGTFFYGNIIKFTAAAPIELIKNGDFSLPNDLESYNVNEIPNWNTDEVNNGLVGRSIDSDFDPENLILWTTDYSKSFYQIVGIVPVVQSIYVINFKGNYVWTDWDGWETDIEVLFSCYEGEDISNRSVIGSVKIKTGAFPGWGNNWKSYNGEFSIPANSSFSGKNLVIEFRVLPYDGPWSAGVWFNFDDISVIQTLK